MKLKMETSLGDYTFWIYIYRQREFFLKNIRLKFKIIRFSEHVSDVTGDLG